MIAEFKAERVQSFTASYRRLIFELSAIKNYQAAAFLSEKLMLKLAEAELFTHFANCSPGFEKYHGGQRIDLTVRIEDKLIATAFIRDFIRFAKNANCYENLVVQTPHAAEIVPYVAEDGCCIIFQEDRIAVALE